MCKAGEYTGPGKKTVVQSERPGQKTNKRIILFHVCIKKAGWVQKPYAAACIRFLHYAGGAGYLSGDFIPYFFIRY